MNKCRNPDHPHCTHWVMQGARACTGGHEQLPGQAQQAVAPGLASPSNAVMAKERRGQASVHARPTLHVSGFDPRAAGGRQALRLELRGMPPDVPARLVMHLRSALLAAGTTQRDFARTRHGEWPPAVIEFTSRGREHGQYPIEVELLAHRDGAPPRRWTCTVVVLVPRPDATLTEIHQTFLATHKNVRVMADDGSIARLGGSTGGGRIDIDLTARNGSIAQLNLDAAGQADLALSSIAWDEELIETGMAAAAHPQPLNAACLGDAAPEPGGVRHIRLFAFDECVLGRLDTVASNADVLLAHYGERGPDGTGLTRRLSAQHAILRCGMHGIEIEDISRYGLLLDGAWPGKHVPVPVRPGMRIEFTASVRNVVTFEVTAVLAHGVMLHRVDAGQAAESICFLVPGRRPAPGPSTAPARAAALSCLYHANDGFWHIDRGSGRETPLCDLTRCERLPGLPPHARFSTIPYPDLGANFVPRRRHGLGPVRARPLPGWAQGSGILQGSIHAAP